MSVLHEILLLNTDTRNNTRFTLKKMISDFYPIQIHEARYNGSYEGGKWAIIAGLRNPREVCDAFAGDTACRRFWSPIGPSGAVKTTTENVFGKETEVEYYVNSGDEPNELVKQHREWLEGHDEYMTVSQKLEKQKEERGLLH